MHYGNEEDEDEDKGNHNDKYHQCSSFRLVEGPGTRKQCSVHPVLVH